MRDIVILGSTGSIGVQALELVAANPDLFRVVGLSAGSQNLPLLFEQARTFRVPVVGTTASRDAWGSLADGIAVIDGALASTEIAAIPCDIVLNGITGSIGLGPTLSALGAGNKVALANKESLVAGGPLVMKFGADRIIPVDSEHSALYQALLAGKRDQVKKFIITASGGAFRDRKDLTGVTLEEALMHPTWSMGPMVTINSATLMNKGLEIIEVDEDYRPVFDTVRAGVDQLVQAIQPQAAIRQAGQIVFTTGAWIGKLLDLPVEAERTVLGWFSPVCDFANFSEKNLPVWIVDSEASGHFYGFPTHGIPGFKLGRLRETPSPSVDPGKPRVEPNQEDEADMRQFVSRYFPSANGPILSMVSCFFENTPDRSPIIDGVPGVEGAWVLGGFSGHGFKYATVTGEIAKDLVTKGSSTQNLAPFKASRFVIKASS